MPRSKPCQEESINPEIIRLLRTVFLVLRSAAFSVRSRRRSSSHSATLQPCGLPLWGALSLVWWREEREERRERVVPVVVPIQGCVCGAKKL